jgi:hypothetical protein
MPANAPAPGKFDQDPRVHFDKTAGKWQYEDEESGQEYEWSDAAKTWIPLVCLSSTTLRPLHQSRRLARHLLQAVRSND